MKQEKEKNFMGLSRQDEEAYLVKTLSIVQDNVANYGQEVSQMQADIDEMLAHYHDNDIEVLTILNNTVTLHEHMKRALLRNEKAMSKPYFGRIIFQDENLHKKESIYIGKGGISKDTTHWMVVDWRAPAANVYYENGLGKCSYSAPDDVQIPIELELKRTYEIENGRLLDFFDTEVVANDDLLTKYLAKNKQAVLSEIIATIQKEQNDIIRKSPYHNMIVQGVAGSGKTTVAMHRISFILYNYAERFKPDDFYIVGSNRILLNYITGVLPDLDVYGIRQMTMEQLFVRLLYEDWDDKKYRIVNTGQNAKNSVKGTRHWFRDLEAYCLELEWMTIPRESVFLNPRQFVEGIQNGKTGVFDTTHGQIINPTDLKELVSRETIERYIQQNPSTSIQSKINMLNERLMIKIKDEFLGKGVSYTENERKAIRRAYRGRYGGNVWKRSIYDLYQNFLQGQAAKGYDISIPETEFDVYDLAALAYLYKRVKETDEISEAHHVVIDEAQDFGMMAYSVLKFCIKDCTYTIMGDVSQNIHFGYGLNDWNELKNLYLTDEMDSFGVLKKSYRNTVEISEFATKILHHGQFSIYPAEPIIRHGSPVQLLTFPEKNAQFQKAAAICKDWQSKGLDTIAVICRNKRSAEEAAVQLGIYAEVIESDLEKAVFGSGIMTLPVEYTKGLEFDAVLILNPTREEYPVDDGHAKLLYVAATRALHELCIIHDGNLTGLISDPVQKRTTDVIKSDIAESSYSSHRNARRNSSNASNIPSTSQVHRQQVKPSVTPRKSLPAANALNRQPKQTPAAANAPGSRPQQTKSKPAAPIGKPLFSFGDMPATEILRPAGHSKIDLAIRWSAKQPDGLYLQSRYGVLRLCPVGSAIIRVTFVKGQQMISGTNPSIAVSHIDKTWMYRERNGRIELTTDELCLQIDKLTGAIRYMTRDQKLLLSERNKECRQIETSLNGQHRT
ncbi:MAG: AAA family ATPase, partial [Lachnospiraceae bacterium]|nr:AAA family ATPase [Lachnospiraceae bacterium]